MSRPTDRFVSASELADYAYCPRSYWYRRHPPDAGADPAAVRRSESGLRYHARALRRERLRAGHGAAYLALVVVGLAAVGAGILWWI